MRKTIDFLETIGMDYEGDEITAKRTRDRGPWQCALIDALEPVADTKRRVALTVPEVMALVLEHTPHHGNGYDTRHKHFRAALYDMMAEADSPIEYAGPYVILHP